jgi:hypothetical protein
VSVALFAAALLCKEHVALLPLVLLLPGPGDGGLRARLRRAWPLLAAGVAMLLYLALGHVRAGSLGGRAYAMGFGANLFHNFMTYCAWAVDLRTAAPDTGARISLSAWRVGLPVVVAWAALAWLTRRRTRLPVLGAAWWALSLAPVVPLLHHSYLYYMYTPFAGLAMAAGGVLDWLRGGAAEPRRRPARAAGAWAVAALAVLAHAGVSSRLLGERAAARVEGLNLPADPYLRKSETARNAVTDAAAGIHGPHLKVLFFTPKGAEMRYDAATGKALEGSREGGRTYDLLEESLDGGRALRLVYPALDSVIFVKRMTPAHRDFDILVYNAEGHVLALGRGPQAHGALVNGMLRYGYSADALDHLAMAVPLYPDDAQLRYQYALLLGRAGRSAEGVQQLREIVRRAPGDPVAARARELLTRVSR